MPTRAELRSEILSDPAAVGYAGKEPHEIAALLNDPARGETVSRAMVPSWELQAAVVGSEFQALSAVAQRAWLAIVALPEVPVTNANLRSQVAAIWGAGTATRGNLQALETRPGSRAEALWGEGTYITHQQVSEALL